MFLGVASVRDPAIDIIKNRLSNVKHKILILSGKGGVGKSTVTSLLGHALAGTNPDINVSGRTFMHLTLRKLCILFYTLRESYS